MKFWEAMREMQENGKKVRCDSFIMKRGHIRMEKGRSIFFQTNDVPLYILIESEWEEYEEPVQLLSFAEVVKGLKEGKKFKRKGWGDHSAKIHAKLNQLNQHLILTHQGYSCPFSCEDFEANDWIEVN